MEWKFNKEQYKELLKRLEEDWERMHKSIVTEQQRKLYLKKIALSQRPKKKKRRK